MSDLNLSKLTEEQRADLREADKKPLNPDLWTQAELRQIQTTSLPVVEEMHPDLSTGERAGVMNFLRGNDEFRNYFTKEGYNFELDADEVPVIWKEGDVAKYRIDPQTGVFSSDFFHDVLDVGSDIAKDAAYGAATVAKGIGAVLAPGTGGGSLGVASGLSGAMGGALEYGTQALGEALGFREDINMESVLADSAAMASVPFAAPLGREIMAYEPVGQGLQYLRSKAQSGVEALRSVGEASGKAIQSLAFDSPESLAKALRPSADDFNVDVLGEQEVRKVVGRLVEGTQVYQDAITRKAFLERVRGAKASYGQVIDSVYDAYDKLVLSGQPSITYDDIKPFLGDITKSLSAQSGNIREDRRMARLALGDIQEFFGSKPRTLSEIRKFRQTLDSRVNHKATHSSDQARSRHYFRAANAIRALMSSKVDDAIEAGLGEQLTSEALRATEHMAGEMFRDEAAEKLLTGGFKALNSTFSDIARVTTLANKQEAKVLAADASQTVYSMVLGVPRFVYNVVTAGTKSPMGRYIRHEVAEGRIQPQRALFAAADALEKTYPILLPRDLGKIRAMKYGVVERLGRNPKFAQFLESVGYLEGGEAFFDELFNTPEAHAEEVLLPTLIQGLPSAFEPGEHGYRSEVNGKLADPGERDMEYRRIEKFSPDKKTEAANKKALIENGTVASYETIQNTGQAPSPKFPPTELRIVANQPVKALRKTRR